MYYLIDNDPDRKYYDVEDVLEQLVTRDYYIQDEAGFDEYVDSDGEVTVYGYEYWPSQILHDMRDYDSALESWAEDQVENNWSDYRWEIEHTNVGNYTWICGSDVYVYDDEEENNSDESETPTLTEEQLEASIAEQNAAEEKEYYEGLKSGENFASLMQMIGS